MGFEWDDNKNVINIKKHGLSFYEAQLDLRKIARSQDKSARVESGLAEGEVALATSSEDRPLSAEISWSGDWGALRKSGIIRGNDTAR